MALIHTHPLRASLHRYYSSCYACGNWTRTTAMPSTSRNLLNYPRINGPINSGRPLFVGIHLDNIRPVLFSAIMSSYVNISSSFIYFLRNSDVTLMGSTFRCNPPQSSSIYYLLSWAIFFLMFTQVFLWYPLTACYHRRLSPILQSLIQLTACALLLATCHSVYEQPHIAISCVIRI